MNRGPTSPIRAVTFDVGGTLIEPWPSVGHVYAEVARQFGIEAAPDRITSAFMQSWKNRGSFGYSRGEWFSVVCESFGCRVTEEMFHSIYERFAQPSAWHLFEDVIPALQFAKSRGLKLGIISNWDERLKPLLERFHLVHRFDSVIVSVEVAAHNPESRIFLEAAQALDSPAEESLHIGDSEREDVLGATEAGMQARKIDRQRNESLLEILQSLGLESV